VETAERKARNTRVRPVEERETRSERMKGRLPDARERILPSGVVWSRASVMGHENALPDAIPWSEESPPSEQPSSSESPAVGSEGCTLLGTASVAAGAANSAGTGELRRPPAATLAVPKKGCSPRIHGRRLA